MRSVWNFKFIRVRIVVYGNLDRMYSHQSWFQDCYLIRVLKPICLNVYFHFGTILKFFLKLTATKNTLGKSHFQIKECDLQ